MISINCIYAKISNTEENYCKVSARISYLSMLDCEPKSMEFSSLYLERTSDCEHGGSYEILFNLHLK